MKRTIPLYIASITGFVIIISYFIPQTQTWEDKAMIWFEILASVAFILGGANLLKVNLQKISDAREGWGYALVTVVAFVVTLVVGLSKLGVMPSESYPTYSWSGAFDQEGSAFWWIYQYMFYPLQATMFALLAFFVASAAFRAFRAKNTEAIILLSTAFIVLLGRTYAGIWLTNGIPTLAVPDPAGIEQMTIAQQLFWNLRLDRLTTVIMDVFNLAGTRAITIGIALGVVSTSLKILLGVDRSYLGSERD